ncbi:MAG: ABC transporter permease subunit [Pseudomonadales bacterium]
MSQDQPEPSQQLSSNLSAIDFSDSKFARRRRVRALKDKLATGGITLGGVTVIFAIVLIFFYLIAEVIPLFKGASMERESSYSVPAAESAGGTLFLTTEEKAEIGLRVTDQGRAVFFSTADGSVVKTVVLAIPDNTTVTSFAAAERSSHLLTLGLSDGRALLFKHEYKITYPNDKRHIAPHIEYPYGDEPLVIDDAGQALIKLALRDDEENMSIAAVSADGEIKAVRFSKEEDFISEEVVLEPEKLDFPPLPQAVANVALSIDQRWLFAADDSNGLTIFNVRGEPELHSQMALTSGAKVTSFNFLLGGISLLLGDESGLISQWFLVRDEQQDWQLKQIRTFDALPGRVQHIESEHRRKGFIGVDDGGQLTVYSSTARRTIYSGRISENGVTQIGISPRANGLLVEDDQGQMHFWRIHNEHPEISWSALWEEVWYESYPEPDYVWQSSASTNDFEPKMSLMPLTFGTLKAAFYAMLMAAPLAICGAIYTAHFMAASMRRKIKPLIELMEALPTVILGFLAGLWLAPFVETHLPGIFSLLILTPIGIVLTSFLWTQLPSKFRHMVPEGWIAALLIPVVLLIGWFSVGMSEPMENVLFDGSMRSWLGDSLGVSFDQRNAMVVGLAMGFAVIPTIFSIAEDAIFSVPKHLSNGSLALGATPWQTLTRVVLLTASPGIFSALMIGFGRAVGETMIVLMATGNTPIMDWNIFEGMRTLAANIAVEMPEAEVGSTHFRVLFLAALVLFMFTFVVNTAAEIVRQRLRKRYGSL